MLKSRHLGRYVLAVLVAAFLFTGVPGSAKAFTLLDENFNDVTNLTTATSTRTIANILANNPGQLPSGTTWSAQANTAANINVRRADNTINTSTGTLGFSSYFTPANSTNNFLVLGDDSGQIGSTPQTGITLIRFPFVLAPGPYIVDIGFDYAYRGVDTSSTATDFFSAFITDGITSFDIFNLPSFAAFFYSGGVSMQMARGDLPSGSSLSLVFQLTEASSSATNTAAGVDNVLVTAQTVPEPASFLLIGAGLLGLSLLRKNRKTS